MSMDRVRMMASKTKIVYGNFGGLTLAPGPLVYENGVYRIQKKWNEINSYGSKTGKTEGSTYFSFINIGERFDSRGSSFSTSSGNINNTNLLSFDGYDDWRLLTGNEIRMLIGTESGYKRSGSTVNGNVNKHYSRITTTITHAGNQNIIGYLLFPDNKVITGKTISAFDSGTEGASNVTNSELNNYLRQGCIFLPFTGNFQISNSTWANGGVNCFFWTATQTNSSTAVRLGGSVTQLVYSSNAAKGDGFQTILCHKYPKPIPPLKSFGGLYFTPGPLVYNGADFQVQPYWDSVNSYGSKYGLTSGSTYFTFIEIGQRFDSRGSSFSNSSGNINNGNPLSWQGKNWRVPSIDEFLMLVGTGGFYGSRNGSTVNGNANKHYSKITTNITYASGTNIGGFIFFPDNQTITGRTLSNFDSTTNAATGVTEAELDNYINQGCVFLPLSGEYHYSKGWQYRNTAGYDWSSTSSEEGISYAYPFSYSNYVSYAYEIGKNSYSFMVTLCTDAN